MSQDDLCSTTRLLRQRDGKGILASCSPMKRGSAAQIGARQLGAAGTRLEVAGFTGLC